MEDSLMVNWPKSNARIRRVGKIAKWIFWAMVGASFIYIALRSPGGKVSREGMIFLVVSDSLILWKLGKYVRKNHIDWFPYGDARHLASSTRQNKEGDNDG